MENRSLTSETPFGHGWMDILRSFCYRNRDELLKSTTLKLIHIFSLHFNLIWH